MILIYTKQNKLYMSEKNTLIRNNRENSMAGLPKSNLGHLVGFFVRKLNVASDFVHRWAKP
jgi:hypothetical protein